VVIIFKLALQDVNNRLVPMNYQKQSTCTVYTPLQTTTTAVLIQSEKQTGIFGYLKPILSYFPTTQNACN